MLRLPSNLEFCKFLCLFVCFFVLFVGKAAYNVDFVNQVLGPGLDVFERRFDFFRIFDFFVRVDAVELELIHKILVRHLNNSTQEFSTELCNVSLGEFRISLPSDPRVIK